MVTAIETQASAACQAERAQSSPAFDWLMAILTSLTVGGGLTDGWAHAHGFVDQVFITPWHVLLYSSLALNGLVLLAAGIRGLRQGYSFGNALPAGYWVAASGVVVFLAGGAFDAWWHTVFGIESGTLALLISPSHLVLALGATMLYSGPLLSVAAQYDRDARGWKIVGPAIVSTLAVAISLAFFMAYAQPIEDGFSPLTLRPAGSAAVYPMLYAADTNGTLTRLAVAPKTDLETVDVSPDGKRIVYRVNRYQDSASLPPSDLYVANADASHPVRITASGRHDTQPAWSPDGASIAYVSMPAESSGDFRIVLTSPDGRRNRVLLEQITTIRQLAWSPDGKSIAFGSRNGITSMIAVLDVATGKTRWLPSTAGGTNPVWTRGGVVYAGENDGTIRESTLDGSKTRTLATATDGSPAISRDGRQLAYLAKDLGGDQLFVTPVGASNARDVSQLSGMDVQDAVWTPNGRLLFVAQGRRDITTTGEGRSLAMSAIIIQAIILAGMVLLLVRRFRTPLGTFAFALTIFALAMALQSDYYFYAIGALLTGVLLDVAIAIFGKHVRTGAGFYAVGFGAPFLFTICYLIESVRIIGGGASGWEWNLLLGAPVLAGVAGLLLAFCFNSPLESRIGLSRQTGSS